MADALKALELQRPLRDGPLPIVFKGEKADALPIVAHQHSRFTHYYFYVCDEALGPMVVRVASFFPFQLNGHSFIEQELKRAGIGFRKDDNAFLAVGDVAALQAATDRLSPEIIRRRLDYWTLNLGPKFSKKERQAQPVTNSTPSPLDPR